MTAPLVLLRAQRLVALKRRGALEERIPMVAKQLTLVCHRLVPWAPTGLLVIRCAQ
jgi:hypothetical protein